MDEAHNKEELSDASIVWLPSRDIAKALLRVATLGALRQLADNTCSDPTCPNCRQQALVSAQAVQLLPGAQQAALTFFVREGENGKHVVEIRVRDRAILRRPSAHAIARMVSDIEQRAQQNPGAIEVVWGDTTNTQGDS